ncbi:MAG: DUF4159 domain-containing protein [Fimbriimonadaceae bacterium]|nr:DUF4159 domain-containing protein [Chitinophagales bacterium]
MKNKFFVILLISALPICVHAQQIQFALLKYSGGGDWYNDVHSLKNLAEFCNKNLQTDISTEYVVVESGSPEIFNYPFVYLTGHGNIIFNDAEAENLRKYLISGGFLFINDDFGLDPYIRVSMKKVFPELEFIELPYTHPVYHQKYEFKNGIPKIHEHDGKPAQAFGIFYEGRMIAFYNYETDLGDGWDDVHKDPEDVRQKALQMGANVIQYIFMLSSPN